MIRIIPATVTVKRGIALEEVGINVRRFQVRYMPEVDIRHPNYVGETVLRSVSMKFSREASCEGEIKGNQGIMAFALGAACAFANSVGDFPSSSFGTLLLDDATVSQERTGWKSVAVRCSSNPLLG